MAKLIYESLEILDPNNSDASQGVISNIVVDSIEPSIEAETVAVEDNREINESFIGRIVCRTKNVNFDGGSDPILGSAFVSTDGTLPSEGKLRLNGKAGSHDLTTGASYIMGHYAFDNGRLEIVLSAQSADVDSANVMTVATAS